MHLYESLGDIEMKIPTEILISDRREYELAEQGFIALTMRKGSDNAAFFSANSCQKPRYLRVTSAEGKAAELNYRLGAQLPYLFIVSRLAHYIKVLQREHIGSWKERTDLERELNTWVRQFVADQENPSSDTRSRRPLRDARVVVEDVEGDPGLVPGVPECPAALQVLWARTSRCPWSESWTRNRTMAGSLFDRLTRGEAGGLRMDGRRIHTPASAAHADDAPGRCPGAAGLRAPRPQRPEPVPGRGCAASAAAAIEECIAKYEPRLALAPRSGMHHLDDSQFAMGFHIEAVRAGRRRPAAWSPWRWSVVMDGEQVRGAVVSSFNRYYLDELVSLRELGREYSRNNPSLAPFFGHAGPRPGRRAHPRRRGLPLRPPAPEAGRRAARDNPRPLQPAVAQLPAHHPLLQHRALPAGAQPDLGRDDPARDPKVESVEVDGTKCLFQYGVRESGPAQSGSAEQTVFEHDGQIILALRFELTGPTQLWQNIPLSRLRLFFTGEPAIAHSIYFTMMHHVREVRFRAARRKRRAYAGMSRRSRRTG